MDNVQLIGYSTALLIGISLGLLGGGGSILTVPVLVYIMGISPVIATAYSLFIVGISSFFGAANNYRKNLVSIKTALIFGIPSIISVFSTRKFLVPALPDVFFTIGSFSLTKDIAIMVLFASLMIAASISMIKKKKNLEELKNDEKQVFNFPRLIIQGLSVGVLAGLVGAGGGFLIIPALVVFSKLSMKKAVGTSLLIISINSLFGFIGDLGNHNIDWTLLLIFSSLAIAGIFIGGALASKISNQKLKPAFGWFILVMGTYILIKELLF